MQHLIFGVEHRLVFLGRMNVSAEAKQKALEKGSGQPVIGNLRTGFRCVKGAREKIAWVVIDIVGLDAA